MRSIRLITDQATAHFTSIEGNYLITQKNSYLFFKPKGRVTIVGFCQHVKSNPNMPGIVKEAIDKDIGVVYVCDKLPEDLIVHQNIVYLVVSWAWFIHTLFFNPLDFKGCFHNESTYKLANAFSQFTKYKIPVLNTIDDIKSFTEVSVASTNNILLEIEGGVGDHLLTIPIIKTLHHKGKNIFVLCEKQKLDCFSNLDYIERFYTKRDQVDVAKFDRINWLNFGQLLNDYRLDLNKQNRIYAIANICRLRKEELVYDVPEIILSKQELSKATSLYKGYSNKIFFGLDSNRPDTRIPTDIAQKIISRLHYKGFTVFISSLRGADFKDCVNLNKKLNLRELFMLISQMDSVLTVDSSFLHIASAFNIKTFLLMNYFNPDWRCSTYTNVVSYTPKVKCYPCVAGQFVCGNDRVCNSGNSCFYYFNWEQVLKDIYTYFKVCNKTTDSINTTFRAYRGSSCSSIYYKENLKLLINRTSGFGDILMITSLVNTIKEINPSSSVTIRTNHPEVLLGISNINRVISTKFAHVEDLSIFKQEYDLVLDLQYSVESKHVSGAYGKISEEEYMQESRIDLFHKFAGLPRQNIVKLSYEVSDKESHWARNIISKLKHKKTIIISINSTSPYRTYPIDLSIYMINKLITDYNIICVGNIDKLWKNKEHQFNKYYFNKIVKLNKSYFVDLTDKTSIREVCSLISEADLLIAPDSGLLHVANAVGTPAIGLFGNIDPHLRCSFYGNTISKHKDLKCLCGDRFKVIELSCPNHDDIESGNIRRIGADCMRFISPLEIVTTSKIILSNTKTNPINMRDILLPFCEASGVVISNDKTDKIKSEDILISNIDNIEKFNLLNINYIYINNYLTNLDSEDKVMECLDKLFSIINYNGMILIKNKIPFLNNNITKKYDSNFCLLYIKQLLKRLDIKNEEIYRIDLTDNKEFVLVLRKLK